MKSKEKGNGKSSSAVINYVPEPSSVMPTLAELVKRVDVTQITHHKASVDRLAARCRVAIVDQNSYALAVEVAKEARAVAQAIDTNRKAIKEPFLEAGRYIDGLAKKLVETLEAATKDLRSAILEYDKKREQEALEAERKRQEILDKEHGAWRDCCLAIRGWHEKAIKELNTTELKPAKLRSVRERLLRNLAEAVSWAQELVAERYVESLDELGKGLLAEYDKTVSDLVAASSKAAQKRALTGGVQGAQALVEATVEATTSLEEAEVFLQAEAAKEAGPNTLSGVKAFRLLDITKVPADYLCLDEKKVKAAMANNIPIPGVEYYLEKRLVLR